MSMRLAFAGTPEFAATALQAILAAGYEVGLVLTQPDRPAGRGLKLRPSPVKQSAQRAAIEVLQPRSLRLDGAYAAEARQTQEALLKYQPQVMVVVAYGLILPQWLLDLPEHGCLNIHASLLPRWRGAAPIQRAIQHGDSHSGITIMQMDAGLDTGPMLLQTSRPLAVDETAASLHAALANDGAQAILTVLQALRSGAPLRPEPQPASGFSYAEKIAKAEAALDFNQPCAVLERKIRAFDPFPGATARLAGAQQVLKVWAAQSLPGPLPADVKPGELIKIDQEGLDVAAADGVLRITCLQRPGGRRQQASELAHSAGFFA